MKLADRILCGLGLHGRWIDTQQRIVNIESDKPHIIGMVMECSKCGRRRKEYVW